MATYSLPDLPYDYTALEPAVSGKIMDLHHDKHHAAYVTGANATLDRLLDACGRDAYADIVGLEKTLSFNISGHVLHSIFWQNLSPDGGGKPDGVLSATIDESFDSFDNFKRKNSHRRRTPSRDRAGGRLLGSRWVVVSSSNSLRSPEFGDKRFTPAPGL